MSETTLSQFVFTLDASPLASTNELILGLFKPVESGVANVTFDVTDFDNTIVHQSFDGASAAAAFTNHPLDLGSVADLSQGGLVSLNVSLSETTTGPGDFFGGILLGARQTASS